MRESEHAVSRITLTAVVTMLALMLAFTAYGPQRSQAQTSTASEEVSGTLLVRFGDPPPGSDAGTRTDSVLAADRGGDETELVLDRGDTASLGGPLALDDEKVRVEGEALSGDRLRVEGARPNVTVPCRFGLRRSRRGLLSRRDLLDHRRSGQRRPEGQGRKVHGGGG